MNNKILYATIVMLAASPLHSQIAAAQGAEATPSQAEEKALESEQSARGSVSRATFTTAIQDGKPIDYRQEIENSVQVVYFFAELNGMAGQTVTHRWIYHGTVMAEAKFDVTSARSPTWSSNKMPPESIGLWIVEVLDGDGKVISRNTLNYLAPL